jgi:hypothetical protein
MQPLSPTTPTNTCSAQPLRQLSERFRVTEMSPDRLDHFQPLPSDDEG